MTPATTTGRRWEPLAYHEAGQWPKGWREVKGWYVTRRGRIGLVGADTSEDIDIWRWRWARDPYPQIPSLWDVVGRRRHTSIKHKTAILVVDEHNRLMTILPIFE